MRRLGIVLAAACLLSLAALALFVRGHAYSVYDDAFIYLRYVKNIRAGCGLRFNCSEAPVEGFSGPLWLFLLVVGSQFTRKLLTLTQVLGTASLAGVLVAAPLTAAQTFGDPTVSHTRRGAAALSVVALLACDHYTLVNATLGLETPLAALTVLLTYAALGAEKRRTAVLLTFVTALLRPEGIVLVAGLFVFPWARTRRVVAACVAGVAVMVVTRWLVFHDVVPNTVWAKAGGTPRHLALGLAYVGEVVKDFPVIVAAPLVLAWPAARPHAVYLFTALIVWVAGVVYAGGDCFLYGRLVYPFVPTLFVCAAQGAFACVARAPERYRRGLGAAPAVAVCAAAIFAMIDHTSDPQHGFENVQLWGAIGRYLKVHAKGKRLATVPIGALGYYSELELLDLVGLTSRPIARARRSVPPEMLRRNWIGHERNDLEYSLAWAPDLIIYTVYSTRASWKDRIDQVQPGFYADELIYRAALEGKIPYRVEDLEIEHGFHVFALAREGVTLD